MKHFRPKKRIRRLAFTLVELMTAMAVLTLLMVVSFAMVAQITSVWKRASQKIDAFQNARLAFDVMTRHLAHATLNSYIDYDDPSAPRHYLRKSDLKFLIAPAGVSLNGSTLPGTTRTGQCIFFVGPGGRAKSSSYAGIESLLNVCGYYVTFQDSTKNAMPQFIQAATGGQQSRYRFQLMQLVVPTDVISANGSLYPYPAPTTVQNWKTWQTPGRYNWFADFVSTTSSSGPTPIADNIIALIIRPWDPSVLPNDPSGQKPDLSSHNASNPDYIYDSTENATTFPQVKTANQLPPVLLVTMIAIDEVSAQRMENGSSIPNVIANAMTSPRFTVAANYTSDLAAVEDALSNPSSGQPRIQYRVFSSAVPILESKWTK